jgi:hypothetical protein
MMLPTPADLREKSRRYREAATKTTEAELKRQLAAHAATLAEIAEALARKGELVHPERAEHYERLLAGPLGEKVQRIVQELLQPAFERDAQAQIKAWQLRAEELRTTADGFSTPSAQASLRRAAANYDLIAEQAQARLSADSAPRDDFAELRRLLAALQSGSMTIRERGHEVTTREQEMLEREITRLERLISRARRRTK